MKRQRKDSERQRPVAGRDDDLVPVLRGFGQRIVLRAAAGAVQMGAEEHEGSGQRIARAEAEADADAAGETATGCRIVLGHWVPHSPRAKPSEHWEMRRSTVMWKGNSSRESSFC